MILYLLYIRVYKSGGNRFRFQWLLNLRSLPLLLRAVQFGSSIYLNYIIIICVTKKKYIFMLNHTINTTTVYYDIVLPIYES